MSGGGKPRAYPFSSQPGVTPDPMYAQLRHAEPVCRVQMPYGGDAWLVTTYRHVRQVYADPRFSRAAAIRPDIPREGPVPPSSRNIMGMDPPEHTRLRGLVAKAFTARRVDEIRPRAQQITAGLLDSMAAAGPPAGLAVHLSRPLPAIIICELLGIPEADRQRFRLWADAVLSTTALPPARIRDAYGQLAGYFTGLITQRRAQPGGDLLSALVRARDADGALTEQELVVLAMTLLVAGYETTANMITNMVYTLLTQPGHLEQVQQHPGILPQAIEEMLRYIALASSSALPRVATEDIDMGGITIRAGDAVLPARPSANRDETVFPEPDRLDFGRDPNPHMAFGYGPHYCLGAHLARMELQVSIGSLLARFPRLEFAVPAGELNWTTGMMVRGLTELPVTW